MTCCVDECQSLQSEAAATEMEKRRQKLQEQQMKRRVEQEQRRMALEAEMNRKRETQKYVATHVLFSIDHVTAFLIIILNFIHRAFISSVPHL